MRCLSDEFTAGAEFHIYNHAIDQYDLFYDDEDYDYFLNKFSIKQKQIPSSVIAYCLMPDHYHFLIRQENDEKIFKIFNHAFISYAKHYNNKYLRKGPIFRSPLQHKLIDEKKYLLQLCKYIHMNPVRKNLVELPEQWNYSDYNDWINHREGKFNSMTTRIEICTHIEQYQKFINSYSNYLNDFDFRKLTFRNR